MRGFIHKSKILSKAGQFIFFTDEINKNLLFTRLEKKEQELQMMGARAQFQHQVCLPYITNTRTQFQQPVCLWHPINVLL